MYFNNLPDQSWEQAFIKFIGVNVFNIQQFVDEYLRVHCVSIMEQKLNCTVTSEHQLLGLKQKLDDEYQQITSAFTSKFRDWKLPEYLNLESNLLCVELYMDQEEVDKGTMFFLQQKNQQSRYLILLLLYGINFAYSS